MPRVCPGPRVCPIGESSSRGRIARTTSETDSEISLPARARAGSSACGNGPIGSGRGTCRRRGRGSAGAGDDTCAHNTLSAEATHVQIFYPFHPLHGSTLRVICRPKTGDGAVTVMEPSGSRLKIPVWMLSSACADVEIDAKPHLGKDALLNLTSLLAAALTSADADHDNLLQIAVDRSNGGQRSATATSRPDDRKTRRASARRRKGATRTHRSDGQHFGGDV